MSVYLSEVKVSALSFGFKPNDENHPSINPYTHPSIDHTNLFIKIAAHQEGPRRETQSEGPTQSHCREVGSPWGSTLGFLRRICHSHRSRLRYWPPAHTHT